jgi:hypothetical protein
MLVWGELLIIIILVIVLIWVLLSWRNDVAEMEDDLEELREELHKEDGLLFDKIKVLEEELEELRVSPAKKVYNTYDVKWVGKEIEYDSNTLINKLREENKL